jgi:hemerythrin-like domain-containing protein
MPEHNKIKRRIFMNDSNLKLAQQDVEEALKTVEDMEKFANGDEPSSKQQLKEKFISLSSRVQKLEDILKSEGII